MYYYLSIGTNIDPEINAVNIVKMLLQRFGPMVAYPYLRTAPVNMESACEFFNSLAIIYSHLKPEELKKALNEIESKLGRDREDPLRSIKDRPADIDILGSTHTLNNAFFHQQEEPYVVEVARNPGTGIDLSGRGLPSTECAATVNFDTRAGHIRVLEYGSDRLEYWHKSSLIA